MVLIIDNLIFVNRFLALGTLVLALSACGGSSSQLDTDTNTTQITVAASFYPIEEIVRQVGGTHVDIVELTPSGQGAHDVQLTAKQLTVLSSA